MCKNGNEQNNRNLLLLPAADRLRAMCEQQEVLDNENGLIKLSKSDAEILAHYQGDKDTKYVFFSCGKETLKKAASMAKEVADLEIKKMMTAGDL